MSDIVTLEISRIELEKFNVELTRTVTLLQAQQRESEERQERQARLDAQFEQMMFEIVKGLENVGKHLGDTEITRQYL